VRWLDRECLISKILQPEESNIQIEALENLDLTDYVNYENATLINILEIEGPEMDHSDIPQRFQSYCPEGFTAKAIHLLDEKNIEDEDEEGFLIKDPDMNFDIQNYDPAPHVTDTLHFLRRKKRDVCIDAHYQHSSCHTVHIYCPRSADGCPHQAMYYRCSQRVTSSTSREYILTCSTAGGPNHEQCMRHYTARGRACRPCCKYYDCGGNLPKCSSSSQGDCFQEQAAYEGHPLGRRTYYETSVQDCQRKCQQKTNCQHFNFKMEEGEDEGECKLQTRKGNYVAKPGCTGCKTGPRACP